MHDFFKNNKQKNYPSESIATNSGFPDFNARWKPQLDDGLKTKFGKNIEKGTDIIKKASNFCIFAVALAALVMLLPPLGRLMYEFSIWAFDSVGNIFP